MAPDKRARCETEDPEDNGESTNGSVKAKKSKTANDEAGSSKKQRPPRTLAEEQELNKLDQNEYVKIIKKLSNPATTFDVELLARRFFWGRFYARGQEDTCPEDHTAMLNSRGRDTVAERRKACPWFFWGLDGYARQKFPEGWTYFYEDGDEGGDSLDSPLLFPWERNLATSADTGRETRAADKTGSFALPLDELEKAIEKNKKEISRAIILREKKRAQSDAVRGKAIEFQAKSDKFNQKINEFSAKFVDSNRKATDLHREADELDAEIAQSDNTLKEKQPLLEVQKLVLAARRANDSYGNQ